MSDTLYMGHEDVFSDVRASDISATPSRISGNQPISATPLRISPDSWTPTATTLAQVAEQLPLGWSHYLTLLSVSNPEARRFYEIEAAENGWSVRELKRQLDSSLYQRLALSRDNRLLRCYVLIDLKTGS